MRQISPNELADWLADPERQRPFLLDVREMWEYEHCHLVDSVLIPMHTVPLRMADLDPEADVVVVCHHGGRSMQVAMFLERNGFSSVFNLQGGVDAWAHDVDPAMRRY